MTTFADLGLSDSLLQALRDVGYESPSPIQEQAIPPLLEGRDVIGQAQTGTGKTAAFGLPLLEYVDPADDAVQALVLTPTRELCIQVTQALRAYGARKGIDVVAVFGGAPIRSQQAQLRASVMIGSGIVAENSIDCRVSGICRRIRSMSGRKPRSSISSASSSTRKRQSESTIERREIRSRTRPTVPTTTWPPARSCACWERMGAPPNTATTSMPLRAP